MAAGGEPLSERFGECKSLTKLDLSYCKNLESLPDRCGDFTSLTELNLYECRKLQKDKAAIAATGRVVAQRLGSARFFFRA